MKLRGLFGFVVCCLCLFAGMANGEPETHLLRLSAPEADKFDIKLEVHAKNRMQMLFMPSMETYFRLAIDQNTRLINTRESGIVTSETQIATASLDYYMPGQPNQGMSDSLLESLLWASGLGSRETPVTAHRNSLGIVTSVEGVPEKYQMYYQHDLIFYPENPVKVGDSWQRKFTQPVAVDFNQAPYDIDISGEYTFKRLLNDGKDAEITFKFLSEADSAMQQGNKVTVNVKMLREGSMLISLKDGWPRSVKSTSSFDLTFSEQNFIKSEEEYKSVVTEIKREQIEKAD
ncbi:MAG TPA: hypothetical protein DCG57_18475 [Candidatus Riflebacteria bacterium]|jgi:hypothetical protein|nr:hypothetical protein [Candidatus Riflebacteria bacterium]